MNYRHIFHAGSFADVFKHCILSLILEKMSEKDKAFSYIDTHAGIGLYDLQSEAARRSPEFEKGIKKLLSDPNPIPELTPYLNIVKKFQPSNQLAYYPGSPLFANAMLRTQDKMILNEYHPEDFQLLKTNLGKDPQLHYHHRDAYEFLPAVLPPTTKRGVILIDPPFERDDEFSAILEVVKKSGKRFSQGVYMIWYPIVSQRYQTFVKQMISNAFGSVLISELSLDKIYFVKTQLVGCGVVIINPPWQLDIAVKKVTAYLWQLFNDKSQQGFCETRLVESPASRKGD